MKFNILAAASVICAGMAAMPALAKDATTLRFSMPNPSAATICKDVAVAWGAKVEADSDGTLKIDVKCDSVLSKVGDTFDRVSSGVADIGWDLPSRYGKRFASFNAVGVPGLYSDPQKMAGALWNVYDAQKIGPDSEMQNLKVLWFNVAPNGGLFMKGKLDSHTDLAGAKVAVGNSIRAAMIKEMGGVPLSLSVREYYQSISKGAAQGTMTSAGAVAALKIDEVTDYFVTGPFGGGLTFFVMNKDKYDTLSDVQKAAIDKNSGYDMSRMSTEIVTASGNAKIAKRVEAKGDTTVVALTDDEVAAWTPAFEKATKGWVDANPDAAPSLTALVDALKAEK